MIVFLLLIAQGFVDVGSLCPVRCHCSRRDSISCTDKSIIDIATLSIPNNFTFILISNTQAAELTEWSFQQMTVTLRLSLEANKFSTITPGAFQNFPELKSLKLTNNNLNYLPPGVFHPLSNLEQLFLDRNALLYLDPFMFDNLRNLRELGLNRNRLTELPAGLLDPLVKLKLLNLSRNKLSDLPKHIFSSLLNLTNLLLYDNHLLEITPWMFNNLTELVELHLHTNIIIIIDKDAFYHLPKLAKLLLHKNLLTTLPDGLFLHLPRLSTLSLYENPLRELPTVLFGKMDYLRSLWIYHTDLSTIPNFVFSNLTNLELLVLTRNAKLHSLPPDAFSGLSNLVELSLHTNNFSSLGEDLFRELKQLQNLSLYNNNFDYLPENLFHPLRNLQTVYLNNSNLHTLPGNLFKALANLDMVRLDSNPWACDCMLQEFRVWLEHNMDKVHNCMSLLCMSPLTLKGIPVLQVDALICPYTTTKEYDKSSYMVITASSSWDGVTSVSQSTSPSGENLTSTIGKPFVSATNSSPSDPTTERYCNDTTSPALLNDMGTTTKAVLSEYEIHHAEKIIRFSLPCGKIIYYVLVLNTTMQMFLVLLICFCLLKMRKLYNYFNSFTEPVVLLRILIPLSSTSQVQNK